MENQQYQEMVKNNAAALINQLISETAKEEAAEIHYDYNDHDQWAIISLHLYDEDKEISVRLHADDTYDLYFGYYDEEDEFFDIIHPLTNAEKELLPEALRKLMKSVVAKEEGMRVPASVLRK